MNLNGQLSAQIDLVQYQKNRQCIPLAALVPFAGQWVAISGDGSHVLIGADTIEELGVKLDAAGIGADSVGWERIPATHEDGWL